MSQIDQLLTLPGSGVFTVHTAADKKKSLWEKLYQSTEEHICRQRWQQTIQNFQKSNKPKLLGICSDTGGGILRGANWGPLYVREQIYSNPSNIEEIDDLGDIRVIPHLLHDKYLNEQTLRSCKEALYQDAHSLLPVSPLSITEYVALELFENKVKLLALGGDHSVSFPLVKSFLAAKKKQNKRVAIIHFDAHTDLLTQRLGIDLCFGSWAYHILQDLIDPKHLIQIGIRSSGYDRDHWEKNYQVTQFWSQQVHDLGIDHVFDQSLAILEKADIQEIYISFDIDAIDCQYASATGTPEKDGLSPDQAIALIHKFCNRFQLAAADLVEVAPHLNTQMNHMSQEPETTLMIAGMICRTLQNYLK